jgi:hypothetical protein
LAWSMRMPDMGLAQRLQRNLDRLARPRGAARSARNSFNLSPSGGRRRSRRHENDARPHPHLTTPTNQPLFAQLRDLQVAWLAELVRELALDRVVFHQGFTRYLRAGRSSMPRLSLPRNGRRPCPRSRRGAAQANTTTTNRETPVTPQPLNDQSRLSIRRQVRRRWGARADAEFSERRTRPPVASPRCEQV